MNLFRDLVPSKKICVNQVRAKQSEILNYYISNHERSSTKTLGMGRNLRPNIVMGGKGNIYKSLPLKCEREVQVISLRRKYNGERNIHVIFL